MEAGWARGGVQAAPWVGWRSEVLSRGQDGVTPEAALLFTAQLGLALNPPRLGWPRASWAAILLQGANIAKLIPLPGP